MESIFGPEGLLARHHPKFEYRPGQIDMARAVHDALSHGGHLCVEAGTGTGKTLAYLIPALALNKRVIISTATKNLQEQLYHKDVPFLEKALGRNLRVAYLKGRSNYLCLHRFAQTDSIMMLAGLEEVHYLDTIRRWSQKTVIGDRAELADLPEELSFWRDIDARAEICLGSKCSKFDECFVTQARRRAEEADIVIVNHHLFFADLAARNNDYGAVLPDYTMVVFDEAHEIEDTAAEYFGMQASNYRLIDLIQDIQKAIIPDADVATDVMRKSLRATEANDRFWMVLARRRGGADGRSDLEEDYFAKRDDEGNWVMTQAGEAYLVLDNALQDVYDALDRPNDPPVEIERLKRRIAQFRFDLEFIVTSDDPTFVYWYERRGRGQFLQATPINLAELLKEKLFESLDSVVLTSATLTSEGKFDFIRARLGLEKSEELIVDSHFDYANQAILYLPKNMPDPRDGRFTGAAADEIVSLLNITQGRAFVLATSLSHMRELYERVAPRVDFPCFVQGRGSKIGLLEKFRRTPGAVLFAAASFWQGVDVQGESLSCVIIDKLPFPVPTDPVVAARHKWLEQQGENPFNSYTVPQAVITLKQGIGRLIRSAEDRGVIAILDPRVKTKNYGRTFLRSLPTMPTTNLLKDVEAFFSRREY